jgi:hypothetical protein
MKSLVLRWSVALLLGLAWGWMMAPSTSNASARPVAALVQR